MCGICGTYGPASSHQPDPRLIEAMIAAIRHRGPDGFGIYWDRQVGLGHARLSIIDLAGGQQPIANEDMTAWIVFNGEIFNYLELREELLARGHRFSTRSDTEVILHLFEEKGPACVEDLNGQFAFAIWDSRAETLFLARDRVGIRPLFYTRAGDTLVFSSEIKSLFCHPQVTPRLDPVALDQIFTFWTTLTPRTAFENVYEIPPAHYLIARRGDITISRYWDYPFPPADTCFTGTEEGYALQLRELLIDATRLQLRADVPVGAYLSGGLDSSIVTALIRHFSDAPLKTFSVRFADETYDESPFQEEMVRHLRTDHREVVVDYQAIAEAFPKVIWHTEKPIVRTAPTPLMLLSQMVRENGIKVVLTGEGSDEILAGYDLFKEAKIRRFWARFPDSRLRPLLLQRLYPYLAHSPARAKFYLEAFFGEGLSEASASYFSHIPRWNTTSKIKLFYSEAMKEATSTCNHLAELEASLPEDFSRWHPLSQAQYLESTILLPTYLLSSQGDRMAMANAVEGRFPYLDHRVVELACQIPPHLKLKVLKEKYILRKSMEDLLPPPILHRHKQPYLAPDSQSFFGGKIPDYVEDLLSPEQIRDSGYFQPGAVSRLVEKCRKGQAIGFKDNMALVGILSTQLLDSQFLGDIRSRLPQHLENVRVFEGKW